MICSLYLMYVLFGTWFYLIHPTSFAVDLRRYSDPFMYHPLWILKSWLPQKTWILGSQLVVKIPFISPYPPYFVGITGSFHHLSSKYGWLNMTTLFEKKTAIEITIFEAPTRPWFHAHSTPPRALVVQWIDGKSKQQPYGWLMYPPE